MTTRRSHLLGALIRRSLLLATASLLTAAPTPLTAQVTTAQLDALRPRNIGPATMSGRIADLAVAESDPVTFYVASATGGVFNLARVAPAAARWSSRGRTRPD